MPLPGTRVIHPQFSEHHRPTATSGMCATCHITRAGGEGTTGPDGTFTPGVPLTVYTGAARVSPRPTDQRRAVSGDRRVVLREYIVAVRWDTAEVRVDDLVTVDEADDPRLPGIGLRVIDVQMGDQEWERILVCEENLTEASQ
ncbi:DUF6093 family protein [Microbispora amethystogenes]|uniref:DUF6093 family protein n=1 Tax=Microbispora amethystogenes TaxID=1427754 RepID=UPI0033FAF7AD